MKAFADDKLNVPQNIKFVFHKLENIVGEGENAGNQHFFPFPTVFVATRFAIKTRIAINYCKTRCDDRNFITFDFTTSFAIKTRIAINSWNGPYSIVF